MLILALERKRQLSSCYHLNYTVPAVREKASNRIALKRTLTHQIVQHQLLYRELLSDYTICFTSSLNHKLHTYQIRSKSNQYQITVTVFIRYGSIYLDELWPPPPFKKQTSTRHFPDEHLEFHTLTNQVLFYKHYNCAWSS